MTGWRHAPTVALASLLVIAVFFGNGWREDLVERTVELRIAQARYSEDSTTFVARTRVLEDSLAALGRAGNVLRGELATAREAAGAGVVTIRALLAQLTPAAQAQADTALTAIAVADAACQLSIDNCEARAAAERGGRLDALEQLRKADSLRTVANLHLADAERRARPSFWRDLWRARAVSVPAIVTAAACLVR